MTSLTPAQIVQLAIVLRPLKPMCDPMDVGWGWIKDNKGWKENIGFNGSYREFSNSIGIPVYREMVIFDAIMLPTYCHELCHAAQRKRMGLTSYLWTKTFHRERLENEATIEEKREQSLLRVNVL